MMKTYLLFNLLTSWLQPPNNISPYLYTSASIPWSPRFIGYLIAKALWSIPSSLFRWLDDILTPSHMWRSTDMETDTRSQPLVIVHRQPAFRSKWYFQQRKVWYVDTTLIMAVSVLMWVKARVPLFPSGDSLRTDNYTHVHRPIFACLYSQVPYTHNAMR